MLAFTSVLLLFVHVSLALASDNEDGCLIHPVEQSYECRLRTLQDTQRADLGVEVSRSARRLRIECGRTVPLESRLTTDHFGGMPSLEELMLDYCKVSQVPSRAFIGLTGLKRLSLQTHNLEWSSMLLEVAEDSFLHLDHLEDLNLAWNNLWSLPQGILCHLPELKKLNLSRNHLLDVADLGLGGAENCRPLTQLTSLDLSHNEISSLHWKDLASATSLQLLDMSHNEISLLGEGALSPELRELNLANNQLAALPPSLFERSEKLEKLHLQNNSLTMLAPGVFEGLSGLVMLNLSRNAISSHLLSRETFSGLESIQVLDLSHNDLSKLEVDWFAGLRQLQVLHLHGNQIHTIKDGSFSALTQLKMISLSHNRLEKVTADTLLGLESLSSLSLDNNELTTVELDAEQHGQLQDLALDHNQLTAVPEFLKDLRELKTLDLGDNLIEEVTSEHFSGLGNLYGLRLASNRLKRIVNSTFAGCDSLHILNLAHNQLEELEGASLSSLQQLRALRLDNNRLEDLNGLISSLSQLQWLNVSSNSLQWFDYAFLPSSLEWLDMSHNRVAELGNFYNLENFNLKTLYASFNRLRQADPASFPSSLELIDLRTNGLKTVQPFTLEALRNLKAVDLRDNSIESLYIDALRVQSAHERPEVLLHGNPLICDCHMGWLPNVNDALSPAASSLPRVADLPQLSCHLPTVGAEVAVQSVLPSQFLCSYQAHCSAQCMCCDFYACDCRFQCPEGCSCFHDKDWSQNVVMCSERGHQHVPILIPLDATTVRLDGNSLRHINTQSFLGRANVRELYLNSSNIVSMGNNTFSGLTSLEVLHLEDNNLGEIRGYEFAALSLLQELYLHNNDLVYINEIAFEPLRNLRSLRLDGNLLTVFPAWRLMANLYLTSLSLSRNTWSCECDFILPFNDFLESRELSIVDYDAIQCISDNVIDGQAGSRVPCPKSQGSSLHMRRETEAIGALPPVSKPSWSIELVPILVPAALALLVLLFGFLSVVVFRKKIKTWLYNKSSEIYEQRAAGTGIASVSGGTYGDARLFDVFVAYATKDADFVDQTLAPTLEHGAGAYRLCRQQQDFPESATLAESIAEATASSSKVLVVLSRAFLACEWPLLRAPLKAVLGKDTRKLAFLLLEDLSDADLLPYPDLVHLLRTCGSVQWGSAACIPHLRCLLPEPAFLTFQRNVTLRHQHVQHVQHQPRLPLPPAPPSYTEAAANLYGVHTYQSIPDTHIYHSLEPAKLVLLGPATAAKPQTSPYQFYHGHSHSASSGTHLLGPTSSLAKEAGLAEEYIV